MKEALVAVFVVAVIFSGAPPVGIGLAAAAVLLVLLGRR